MFEDEVLGLKKLMPFTKYILLFVLFFVVGISAFVVVPTGKVAVVTQFGAVTGRTLNEGLNVKIPFVQKAEKISVQNEKIEVTADSASSDLQTVTATIALNYQINKETVTTLYQNVNRDYDNRIIQPSIQEAVKSATSSFTAEELITKRSEVSSLIRQTLSDKLVPQGINVLDINIVNFNFSAGFDKAVEDKVTAEQNALAEQNRLEQIKFQAEQDIERAKGRAEAIRIESEALKNNEAVIELRALEKWNGVLPLSTGGATPFINLN